MDLALVIKHLQLIILNIKIYHIINDSIFSKNAKIDCIHPHICMIIDRYFISFKSMDLNRGEMSLWSDMNLVWGDIKSWRISKKM